MCTNESVRIDELTVYRAQHSVLSVVTIAISTNIGLTNASGDRACPVATPIALSLEVTGQSVAKRTHVLSNRAKVGRIGEENPPVLEWLQVHAQDGCTW